MSSVPKIRVTQAQRTIVMRVLGDRLRRIARKIDEDLLSDDENAASAAIGFDIKGAVGLAGISRDSSDERLQAVSFRNMYSEHGLEA